MVASEERRPRRRADAERSRTQVLDAAARLLRRQPDAGMAAIAQAAGVTRQTVYAHFSSREGLVRAAVDRMTAESVTALEAAMLDEGSATAALLRFLDASWRSFEENAPLLQAAAPPPQPGDRDERDREEDRDREEGRDREEDRGREKDRGREEGRDRALHEPVTERLARLVERGQQAGEFTPDLPTHWLVASTVALGHAAGDEATSGRMTHADAEAAFRLSVLRLFGAPPAS
ncbi:TetR/AcrR family transcriptional regulator [Streptomyces sp. NBC_00006]|uniref:TetR family transcriptional regulator n=1 Tax=Streptomyces sp. NBC_00006 TaxID=2975619 RepID=UPI0022583138|nr:TetR family transcriptional regulator [Streptomyces sp. NBC_00006]MCX5536248.1 TetR/AcrR family transcriptional regulator [Streptomyces sp. NBC_00006]